MWKSALKETSVLFAFVLLSGILLLSLWISHGINEGVLQDYKFPKVSVVLTADKVAAFKSFIEKDSTVIRYEYFDSAANRDRLNELYPELKNVIAPLEGKFFPHSAIVTVKDLSGFLGRLDSQKLGERKVVHEPPVKLTQFLNGLTFTFGVLWLLSLVLMLYFNVERMATQYEAKWSLMKMLGVRPGKLFLPLWWGQTVRIVIAALVAMGLASLGAQQVRILFAWNWASLPTGVWIGFLATAIIVTAGFSYLIFSLRYRKVSLG